MGEPALYLRKGALVAAPASDEVAIIVESDGSIKSLNAAGTRASIGGGISMEDVISTAIGDVQDLSVTGLNGDLDGDYQFHIDIIYKGGAGLVSFYLQPFGADETSLSAWGRYDNGSGTNQQLTLQNNWPLFSENTAGDQHLIFDGFMTSKTGQIRSIYYTGGQIRVAGGVKAAVVNGWSTDLATNITALRVHASVAASIRAGSLIKLRKLKNTL